MPLPPILSDLQNNPYFEAGFGLFGIGALAALSRKLVQVTSIFIRRHYMITLEIPCRDKSYEWFLQWFTERGSKHTQHLSVKTKFCQNDNGQISTQYDFIPSIGIHILRYGGTWIRVDRNREQHTLDLHAGVPWETVTLTSIGTNRKLFFNILDDARQLALAQQVGKTVTYMAMGPEWRQFGHPKRKRPLDSVVLDEGISERLLEDVKEFINNSEWYTSRGIPYKRGYLLYGPPGCGKSSFIVALAGKLDYSICILNLSDHSLTDDRLFHLLNVAPQQSIILLEDVDAAFTSREIGQQNAAMIRPGRIDFKEYIGFCSTHQLQRMFMNFYPQAEPSQIGAFVEAVQGLKHPVSPAVIQGLFMLHKENPEECIKNTPHLF